MPTEKKLTGYPSIDKPWLKYYSENKSIDFDVNQTLYTNFKRVAEANRNNLAIINYRTGNKFTFGELLEEVDDFSNALLALELKESSKIVVLSFNSMIDPVVLLAANKIGLLIEFLDPESDVIEMRRHTSTAALLVVEGVFLPLAKIISDSIPVVVYNCSELENEDNYLSYIDFIGKGKLISSFVDAEIHSPALIIFSSGSTGAPKPIVHSNFTVNSAIKKMLYSDFPLNRKNFMVKCIPSHIGLGVVTSMLVGLMAGMTQILVGTIDESVFDFEINEPELIAMLTVSETFDLCVNYKKWISSNSLKSVEGMVILAAPIFFKFILSQEKKIDDLSFVKGVLLGGSKMTTDELDFMQSVFSLKGLSVPIGIGYGQNEMCGAVALNTVRFNKNGSAGYPVYGTNIRIVDCGTYEDVRYNQIGLILEKSDSAFLFYDNMPEETLKAKIALSDGSEWYNSNDLGYMDEDGFIYITGRTNRVVIKSDHKVSLDVVETKVKAIDGVKDAALVPYMNGKEDGDTIVFVVTESEDVQLSLDIINAQEHNLTVFEIPVKLVVIQDLPRMNNGKVDFRALEKAAEKL